MGVAAAGRIVRELSCAGFSETWLAVSGDEDIASSTRNDVDRLAGSMIVRIGSPASDIPAARFSGDRLLESEAIIAGQRGDGIAFDDPRLGTEILRRTGKAQDGLVSRWLNRPISRRITALLLHCRGVRPNHATAITALLALLMVAALLSGREWGLTAGALLFQAASILDGVDGEIARATFRSSKAGAALDTAVDVATNLLFVAGLAINLAQAGREEALMLAGGGLAIFLIGLALIGRRSMRSGGGFSLDLVKLHYRARVSGSLAARTIAFLTIVSSRDFFALLFAILILVGLPLAALYLFAAAASVWILFVIGSLTAPAKAGLSGSEA